LQKNSNNKKKRTTKANKGGKAMKLENTKTQMRKGVLEYCILLALESKPLYASEIVQNIEKTRMIAVEGTLYPMLTRMKNDGFLGYWWEESIQGPPRKYYELTETGKHFLNELGKVWNELVGAVLQITDSK
jgi:PadR family transcriptional regulator, regulatory protein PadR